MSTIEFDRTALAQPKDNREVLTYAPLEDGSIMNWLAVSPLPYNAAYIGDSLGYDPFARDGQSESAIRPRAGDISRRRVWRRMQWSGAKEGPSHMDLFAVAARGMWRYGLTACFIYIYSPQARPNARWATSSDDGLKVILNGKKIWSNQIQRAALYDSDQMAAPLNKGWNTLMCVIDQSAGGHYLLGRFKDGETGINDLEISLDPPAPDARRFSAQKYNADAAAALREADAARASEKFAEAIAGYEKVAAQFALSDVAPRALQSRADSFYDAGGAASLNQPKEAVRALQDLLARYGNDLLAEYALLELGEIQAKGLNDAAAAEVTFRAFETRFPLSSLGAKSQLQLAQLLMQQKKFADAILVARRLQIKSPDADETLAATVLIGDAFRLSGEKEKAREQYLAARATANDWYQNKYGIDVGKQAWLRTILESVRLQLEPNA